MEEIWKDISNFEGLYQVSNLGKVRNTKTNKILKESYDKRGYVVYCLYHKKAYVKKAHRLVAETFIPNSEHFPQVNHKDENKHNNNVNNLEWCSNKYNSNYGTRGKRISKKLKIVLKKPILQILNGKIIKKWDGAIDVEKELGIKRSNICWGLKNNKKVRGYIWKYDN